jgi:hypothetical protein
MVEKSQALKQEHYIREQLAKSNAVTSKEFLLCLHSVPDPLVSHWMSDCFLSSDSWHL